MKKNYSTLHLKFRFFIMIAALITTLNVQSQAVVSQTLNYTGSINTFTVPTVCGTQMTIEVRGASGGFGNAGTGGRGARMIGVFNVTQGQVFSYLVGQSPGNIATGGYSYPGGGGGSYVALGANYATATPMIVAGGGGGGYGVAGDNAPTTTSGTGTSPGTNGNGGPQSPCGGGGGGFFSSGANDQLYGFGGGQGFQQGGAGGVPASAPGTYQQGGFGGGAPANFVGSCNLRAGAGGGYSGGSGYSTPAYNIGSAGGSYNSGTSQTNTAGFQTGNGMIILTYSVGTPVNATQTSSLLCIGGTSTLSASNVVSYTWSPGGTVSNSVAVSPTVTTVYTVTGTDSFGCLASSTLAVNVNTAVPSLSIASTATAVCSGKGVSYTASGALTYTWITGNTNNALTTYTPALPGATYSVIGGNACGTSTLGVSVVTNTIPLVTASINTPTVCSGNTVTIIGGGAVTYTWAGGFPNNSPFAPSATTNYSVTGTSAQGCTATAVTAVTVYITPNVPPAVTPTAICVGQTATLSATGATSYSWIPGVNLVTQSVVVSPAAPTTYTLYRDNSGCTSTANISLVVNALPIMSASGTPSNICAGQGANLVVVGPITNTWFPGPFTQSNFTVFPNSSRDYTVVGSNANCTISAVVSISVNPTPTLTVAYTSPTLCSGGTNNLTANGAITYTWMNGTNNLGNNQTISVSPPVTAQYILMGTNASGCTATVNPLVVVYALPNSNIVSSAPFICAGAPAILGVTVTPGSTFSWNTGAITPSITVSPTVTTNYNLTVTTSSTGCQSSSVFPLSVYIATYAITSPTAVCKGNTATITAVGAASNYTWMTGSTTVGTTSVISVSPQVTTVYNVTGSTGGCIYTRTVNLIVNPIPPVRATPDKNPMCYLDPVTIVASGANSYSWSTTSTLTAIDVSQQNITTTYTLTGTDLNGCSKTVTVTQYVATCTGIENYSSNNIAISVYPNPSNGNFFISSDVALDLSVVNTLGQEVSRFKADLNRKEIQLNNLPGGIYFITGQANGIKVNKKIIIDK